MSFQTSILITKSKSALGKTYISKKLVSHIIMVCHDIQQEQKRPNILLIAAHKYNTVLDQKLVLLVEEEKFCQSIKEVLKN